MRRLSDPHEIRTLLETDRAWSVYALGDLSSSFFPHCEWLRPATAEPALLLVCRAYSTPILFALGSPDALRPALAEVSDERLALSIRPELLPLIEERYRVEDADEMWRMVHQGPAPVRPGEAALLRPANLSALTELYRDGESSGESPDFFHPSILNDGACFGVWEGGALVAAAGTHQIAPEEGAATVGNVYVRRDRRGRGWGRIVAAAVTAELLGRGLRTVALNVKQRNTPAIRVYERLGFRRHCPFWEGLAISPPDAHPR